MPRIRVVWLDSEDLPVIRGRGLQSPRLMVLHGNGINVWYDEGIPAGVSWRGEIAAAIKGADRLLFFISAASLRSSHCLREVDYALANDIDILVLPADRDRAVALLTVARYELRADPRNASHELTLARAPITIDLHWDILRPGRTSQSQVVAALLRILQ